MSCPCACNPCRCNPCRCPPRSLAAGLAAGAFVTRDSVRGGCCPLPPARESRSSHGCGCGKCSGAPRVASPAERCCPGDAAAQAALRCCEMRAAAAAQIAASAQSRLQTNNRLLQEQVTLLRASLLQSQASTL